MGEKRRVFLLLIIIFFFSSLLVLVLDRIGVVDATSLLPFLEEENPIVQDDKEFPTEVEKLDHQKTSEKLMEWEERLARLDETLKARDAELKQKTLEIDETKDSLNKERARLSRIMEVWNDRQKKIKDLAGKVQNMPPVKAKEMMEKWPDFDLIDVMRQIDKDAELEGRASITPFLLTLFTAEKRAEITRKMLLPPLEAEEPADVEATLPQ